MENSEIDLGVKLLLLNANVDLKSYLENKLTNEDVAKITRAAGQLANDFVDGDGILAKKRNNYWKSVFLKAMNLTGETND